MSMRIRIEIDEASLRQLVLVELARRLGDLPLDMKAVRIEVKSKQNYRAEWETAVFRAIYECFTTTGGES